jgi:hypothetical protein
MTWHYDKIRKYGDSITIFQLLYNIKVQDFILSKAPSITFRYVVSLLYRAFAFTREAVYRDEAMTVVA